ncbi:lipopolysaccharide biosynthesis protein [Bacillus cereus]
MYQNLKQILLFMVGPFIARLFSFVSLPIISYYVTLKEFGLFTVFSILIMYFTPMITLGTEQYYLRAYKVNTGKCLRGILFKLFSSILLSLILVVSLTLLWTDKHLIEIPFYFWYLGIITAFFNSLQDIYVRTVRYHGRGEIYSIMTFINQFSIFILTLIFVMLYKNVESLVLATSIAAFFNFIVNKFLFNKFISKLEVVDENNQAYYSIISDALKYSIPLLPGILFWILQSSIDRVMISKYLDAEFLGLFGVGLKLGTVVSLFVTSFLIFWEPKIFVYFDKLKDTIQFKSQVNKYKNLYAFFMQIIIAGLLILLPLLIKIMSPDYQEALYIIPLMVLQIYTHGFSYFSGFGPQLTRKTIHSVYPLVISVGVNIALSLLLVSEFKLIGIIFAANISFIVLLVINYLISKQLVVHTVDIKVDILKIIVNNAIALYFAVSHNYVLSVMLILVLIGIEFCINLKYLNTYIDLLKSKVINKIKRKRN